MTGYRAFSRRFVKGFPVLSKGFEIETEMTIHALDKNYLLEEVVTEYRDRPQGSVSKLNTFSDGFRVLKTIAVLFRDYKPLLFFGLLSLLFTVIGIILFIPVFLDFLNTGMVARFPTLIMSGIIFTIGILMLVCGLILDVVEKKHRQLFELLQNIQVAQEVSYETDC